MSDLSEYGARDKLLQSLGFRTYIHYLGSKLWGEISRQVRHRDNRKCRCCGRTGWITHHDQYDEATLRGTDLQHLYTVCESCHEDIEWDGARKRSLAQARSRLAILLGRKTPPRPNSAKAARAKRLKKADESQPARRVRLSIERRLNRDQVADAEAAEILREWEDRA